MRRLVFRGILLGFLASIVAPPPASAEWFVDVFGGPSSPQDLDLDPVSRRHLVDRSSPPTADVDRAFVGGGRLGYWFAATRPWAGLALDVSSAGDDRAGVDVRAVPISLLAMARLALVVRPGFPHGRIQPYVGAGPAGIYVTASWSDGAGVTEASAATAGASAAAGLTGLLRRDLGIFAEYRLTHLVSDRDVTLRTGLPAARPDETAHQVVVGLAFRF